MKCEEDIILIAGPTASGKTGLAIEIAQANDAVIINADSMQVYRDLRIITARPSPEEEASAPHFLFGHVGGDQPYSVAEWIGDVSNLLDESAIGSGRIVFVGGTGFYFNSLLQGLSPVPQIDPAIREKWRAASQSTSAEVLHEHLADTDPRMAAVLRPSDSQRIVRALEVLESTGKSLADWQEKKGHSVLPPEKNIRKLLLMPERHILHERISMRFDQMVEQGALAEVEVLLEKNLPATVSVMKAIGVPQLTDYLLGKAALDEAIEKAKAATRQYAKRQSTWFRNSFDEGWERFLT